MLLYLPNFLEAFPAELTCQFLFVYFALLAIVDMLDVSGDVVAVEEALSANIAGVVSFSRVRFLE